MRAREKFAMRRRDFLLYGSAGVAGAMAFGLRPPGTLARQAAVPELHIGYRKEEGGRIVPARWLPAGDPGLLKDDVLLTIHGLGAEDENLRTGGETLSLFAHFAAAVGGVTKEIPVLCWSCRKEPVRSVGAPVSLTAPVSLLSGLKLSLEGGGEAARAEARFTVGGKFGMPKLRRGSYYLALSGAEMPRGGDFVVMSVDSAAAGHSG